MKEKTVCIDITKKDFNYLNNSLLKEIIDDFLCENKNINLSSMIHGDDLAKVYLEVLANNTKNVKDSIALYDTLEKIYDYWRSTKRYILSDINKSLFINEDNFLTQFDSFNEMFLKAYREICYKLTGKKFAVYRQLPAFAEVFLLLDRLENNPYDELKSAKVISKVAFRTPFVSYSSSNKRTGVFPIINDNPIKGLRLEDKWFVMPILCGETKMLVYFPKRYISLGVSLSNLFQYNVDYKNQKPDVVIVFGSNTIDGVYYDKEKDIILASLVACDKIDYFGYMKKIILTAHNIRMINQGKLPIHGAGVSILFKNGTTKNVVIIGDSGAGKSETLEALREIASDDISDIVTIYDDMGTFDIVDDRVVTYGTEIGAFVRTDDLAHDYVYKVFDRAIFLNPNGKNARLVLPISSYHDVVKRYPVDFVFYANNYDKHDKKVVFIDNVKDALAVFEEGKRVALGTTSEEGLVTTFFANPFGPLQLKDQTKVLLDKYFDTLYKTNIKVGQLYTGLSLPNGKENPREAAEELLATLKR